MSGARVLPEIRPRLRDEHDDREGERQRADQETKADFADAGNSSRPARPGI
jgi:hypothetical protein